MTLSFRTHFKNKPTYFVEKILSGLHSFKNFKGFSLSNNYNHNLDFLETCNSKIHTIKKDKLNKWKIGNDIHFVVNNRTPKRFQFAQIIKCVNIQSVEIIPEKREIWFDGETCYSGNSILEIAENDGFDSIDDFFKYFNTHFYGKIIHWTDLNY